MKLFIGMTKHIGYFSKFTHITITNAQNKVVIYIVPTKLKLEDIKPEKLNKIWTKNVNGEDVDVVYDSSNYEKLSNDNKDANFRLFVNGACIHASIYAQKYLIEFDGTYILKETDFVDH